MPLGKYYCDYCDKEFQDTTYARKRHLQGLQHQRARAIWYNSFTDPGQVYAEGFGSGVCNRFVKTGFCQYGDSCKYLHPPKPTSNFQGQGPPVTGSVTNMPQPPQDMETRQFASSFSGTAGSGSLGISWGNLPPSLKPPPEGGYLPLPFVDWG